MMVQKMIENKVTKLVEGQTGKPMKKDGKTSFFMYIGNSVPNADQQMSDIYNKYKNEDGFLYIRYGEMEKF